MDFEQFLAEGPVEYLLYMMAIPCGAALILVGFLVFSFGQRDKKSRMKLGVQKNKADKPDLVSADTAGQLDSDTEEVEQDLTEPSLEERLNFAIFGDQTESRDQDNADGEITMAQEDRLVADTPIESEAETVELLRLLRHQPTGRFIVEVAGKQYSRLSDITDKKIGQYVLTLTAHLLAFTGGVLITPAGMKSVATPKVGDVPLPLAPLQPRPSETADTAERSEPSLIPRPSPEAEAAFRSSLESFQPTMPVAQQPKSKGLFNLRSSSGPSLPLPTLNLAEEINDIVQTRLRYVPLSNPARVEIRNDGKGGILILVNDQAFHGPDEVTDPEIQKLLRDAIKEWERS